MLARLGAKAVLVAAAMGMAFFGVGLLGLALAKALVALFGEAGAAGVAGGVLLLPPLFWAIARLLFPPAKPKPQPGLLAAVLASVAKDTPWMAVAGASVTGLVELFLNRNKRKK